MTAARTFTVKEVAEMADWDPETVRRWIRSDYIPASRIGREYRISAADLNQWYKSRGGRRLVPVGREEMAGLELEEPEDLEDARALAGRVGQLADDLRGVADALEEWSDNLADTVEIHEDTGGEDEGHTDEWTEDMFGEDES